MSDEHDTEPDTAELTLDEAAALAEINRSNVLNWIHHVGGLSWKVYNPRGNDRWMVSAPLLHQLIELRARHGGRIPYGMLQLIRDGAAIQEMTQ